MDSRKAQKQDGLRQQLIVAARAIIEEQGLSALNVREIAKRTGCAVGMVYKALKGIDDILIHVNAQTLDELHVLLRETATDNIPLETALSKIAHAYIDYHKRNPHLWSAFFEYHYADDYQVPEFFDEKIESVFTVIEKALLPSLGHNREKAFTLARVLWAGVHGICTLSLRGSLSRVKIQSENELVEALVSGIMLSARQTGYVN